MFNMIRMLLCSAVIAFVTACDGSYQDAQTLRFETVSDSPTEHGERLIHVLGCIGCHTLELTGEDWTEPDLGVLWTANLTRSAAQFSTQELTAMIVEGRHPDRPLMDMPSFLFTHVHPSDIAAMVAYLQTLEPTGSIHPAPTIGPELARQIDAGEFLDSAARVAAERESWPPDMGDAHRFGRHIARATCVECHGMDLRGSAAPVADAPPRPDLRAVAAYSAEDFATLMTTGKALGDRELALMSSVARYRYARFTDAEVSALYLYLVEVSNLDP